MTDPIKKAEELRESQIKGVAELLKSLHFRHIARQEADIQRYRAALLDVAEPKSFQMSQGHGPAIQHVIERLRRIAEPFAAKAAENGYTRALMDLKSRGWLHSVHGSVKAPREVVLRIITENDSYLDGFGQDLTSGSISKPKLMARIATYSHYLWRASELAYKQCLQDFMAARKLPRKAMEALREAEGDNLIQCYFAGPDDESTCGGCEDAVNGNPYTLDDAPTPGEFECMSRCRHILQLDGDAPDDLAPFTWSANLGFEDVSAEELADEAPMAELPAARTDAEIAELPLTTLIDADLTPSELADYMDANDLTLDDLEGYIDPADITAIDDAADAMASALPEQDLIDAITDGDVDAAIDHLNNNPNWFQFAVELGRGGLDDDVMAYALADALTDSGTQYDVHLGPEGKWYVVTASNAVELGLQESLREGGKGSGHHGHTGHKGAVGGSVSKFDAAVQTIFDSEVDKARAELEPKALSAPKEMLRVRAREGGEGSGNFGHEGRPGEVGGSGSGDGGADTIRAVAQKYAKQDERSAYSQCIRVSERIAAALNKAGIQAAQVQSGWYWAKPDELKYGAYKELAATPRAQNVYMRSNGDIRVTHSWVRTSDYIVDGSAAQFHGGDALRIVPIDDARYDESHTLHEGGSGSGNFNHSGRPGERGGAGPGTGDLHKQKEAVFMIGGSGSGKGGVIAANYDKHYHMDPDTVKKSIPLYSDKVDGQGMHGPGGPSTYDQYLEYPASERAATERWVQENTPYKSVQEFAATALNDHNSSGGYQSLGSGLTHELSSAVAKASLIQEITDGKHNFVYDSTGSKNYEKWADLAQRYGYHVVFHQVYLSEKTAETRNLLRTRTVPADILQSTHAKVRDIVPGLKAWASNHNVEWQYTSTE